MSARDDLADLLGANAELGIRCDCFQRVLAAGWRPPARIVSTVEELDALPWGSVVMDQCGNTYQRAGAGWHFAMGPVASNSTDVSEFSPVVVLHEGEV